MHRTYIDSQRLLSWFSGFSRLIIWQQSPGCSAGAVETNRICSVFTRPSFDNSAYHTISKCSHNDQPFLALDLPARLRPAVLQMRRQLHWGTLHHVALPMGRARFITAAVSSKIDSGTRTSTICSPIHSGVSFVCKQPSWLV